MTCRVSRRPSKGPAFFAPSLAIVLLTAAIGRGEVASWDEPSIDTWSYTNAFAGGSQSEAPTFAGGITVDEATNTFNEHNQTDPARLGSLLIAFETLSDITAGLEPSRYAINSVTVTTRQSVGSTMYSDQPVTPQGLLAEALGAGITSQQPMELFGVGFRDGYEGFALGVDQSGDRFDESVRVYTANDGGYIAYPIASDAQGAYADVSNNLTGGFSETAAGNHTAPFEASPWAIGTAGLTAGEIVPDNTDFTYSVDLGLPGVMAYLQQSLADGAVGFMVSSVHPAGEQGAGGGTFPKWYTKEAVGVFAGGEAPSLSIDFTILPIAGDYDGDGVVTEADYDEWVAAYGSAAPTPGAGADGNADGAVDAADYTVRRDALATAGAIAVPEPSAGVYALACLATASFCVGTSVFTAPRGPKE